MYGNPSDLLKAILNYKPCALFLADFEAGRATIYASATTIKKTNKLTTLT
jgi:hypothetical protein